MAGMTDYTGVPLDDIVAHFREWSSSLALAVDMLGNIRQRLVAFGDDPAARDGVELVDYFIDLFTRYGGDFDRLLSEMPEGVQEKHVEAVRQLFESAKLEEGTCVEFKRYHHLDALSPSNRVQNVLAEVYRLTRDEVINLKDLSNVVPRLRAYVGAAPAPRQQIGTAANALELKPNFMGIGLNLNYIIDRWFSRWKKKE